MCRILKCLFPGRKKKRDTRHDLPTTSLTFVLYFDSLTLKFKNMAKIQIAKGKFPVYGKIDPSTDNGAKEQVESGSVNYTSDNEGVIKIGPDPNHEGDKTRFQLDWGGSLGTANVGASADADLGEGVKTLTDSMEIEVIEDEATKLNMSLEGIEA